MEKVSSQEINRLRTVEKRLKTINKKLRLELQASKDRETRLRDRLVLHKIILPFSYSN